MPDQPDVGRANSPLSPFLGDPKREAVNTIGGYVYQAWWSIDAWLAIQNDELIYLECAEDFDRISGDSGVVAQVRRTSDPISLGSQKARAALENFWKLTSGEGRAVEYHYITTSAVAKERGADFLGLAGINAWEAARTNSELATKIVEYLLGQLSHESQLRRYLEQAEIADVTTRLFRRFHWFTQQPDLTTLKQSVKERASALLHEMGKPPVVLDAAIKFVESRFWDILVQPLRDQRCLTRAELIHVVESAATAFIPVAMERVPDLIALANPGLNLLELMLEETPPPPQILLNRPQLASQVAALVEQRKSVLLKGGVFAGKTTLAQLVAYRMQGSASWLRLTQFTAVQTSHILRALAKRVEDESFSTIIVLDDLNIAPDYHRVHGPALSLLAQRAKKAGIAVLITAQGASSEAAELSDFGSIEVVDVPPVSADETRDLCVEHGCSVERSAVWGGLIYAQTAGHPKLVHVRVYELAKKGWPKPETDDLITSPAIKTARELARRLLRKDIAPHAVDFVYVLSEASAPLHRESVDYVARRLAGHISIDDIDALIGRWIEQDEAGKLRVTAMLRGEAKEVLGLPKVRQAHAVMHDAILARVNLDHIEAAAMLLHAYLSGDEARMMFSGLRLQIAGTHEAKRAVDRELLWLPLIMTAPGDEFCKSPIADAAIRSLQFRVGSTSESDSLDAIYARWLESVERIEIEELRQAMKTALVATVAIEQSVKLPLAPRLKAIVDAKELNMSSFAGPHKNLLNDPSVGIPATATFTQIALLGAVRVVTDRAGLEQLVAWLDGMADATIRADFEQMLAWKTTQQLGAFVQGAWASGHETRDDWSPWMTTLNTLLEYSERRASRNLGIEAAKAKAIILTEYMGEASRALEVLDDAERCFGKSEIILEQRANLYFHEKDDEAVLRVWSELSPDSVANDPFAQRRVGVSASRLGRFQEALEIFLAAADQIGTNSLELTQSGLRVDASVAALRFGDRRLAAQLLDSATSGLPAASSEEGNPKWEAVVRAASQARQNIEGSLWTPENAGEPLPPGFASTPGLSVYEAVPGQIVRVEAVRAQSLLLAASVGVAQHDPVVRAQRDASSRIPFIRLVGAQCVLTLGYRAMGLEEFCTVALASLSHAQANVAKNRASPINEREPIDAGNRNLFDLADLLLPRLMTKAADSYEAVYHEITSIAQLRSEMGLDAVAADLSRGDMIRSAAQKLARDQTASRYRRCGAAIYLAATSQEPDEVLLMYALLGSALLSGAARFMQPLYSHLIADALTARMTQLLGVSEQSDRSNAGKAEDLRPLHSCITFGEVLRALEASARVDLRGVSDVLR